MTLSHEIRVKLQFRYFEMCIILKTIAPADYFGILGLINSCDLRLFGILGLISIYDLRLFGILGLISICDLRLFGILGLINSSDLRLLGIPGLIDSCDLRLWYPRANRQLRLRTVRYPRAD